MSALPTRIEKEAGQPLTPLQIFDITAARETTLSRLLMLYISTGLLFMLLPGTFLGVWNLLAISSHRAADSVSRGVDSGTWPRSDLRLDRDIHPGHWLLFHSQTAAPEFVRVIGSVVLLGAMDQRRYAAMAY